MGWAWEAAERPPAGNQGRRLFTSWGSSVKCVWQGLQGKQTLAFTGCFSAWPFHSGPCYSRPRAFTSLFFLEKSRKSSKSQTLTFLVIASKKLGKSKPQMLERGFLTFLKLLPAWSLGSFKILFWWCMGRDNKSLLWRQINPGLGSTYSLIKGWDLELTV